MIHYAVFVVPNCYDILRVGDVALNIIVNVEFLVAEYNSSGVRISVLIRIRFAPLILEFDTYQN